MKVYIVTHEWQDTGGGHEFWVVATYRRESDALKLLAEEREKLIKEHNVSIDEMKESDEYEVEADDVHFFLQDADGAWDEIKVIDQKVNGTSAYIDILFPFKDEWYAERIYLDDVDMNHYDDLWDWWFGDTESKVDGDGTYDFELTADKHNDGGFAMTGMYINVYEHDCDEIIATIHTENIKIHTSWSNDKTFESCQKSQKQKSGTTVSDTQSKRSLSLKGSRTKSY